MNKFCHIEFNTDNPQKAKDFYGKLFEWKFEDMDMGPGHKYTAITTGAAPKK